MRLLLKWLRPINAPSPKRKDIPFCVRLQYFLYSACLKILRKFYARYAFSDNISIKGKIDIQICHEYRDRHFESELKRFMLMKSDIIIDAANASSTHPNSHRAAPFFRCFNFADTMCIDINGEKIILGNGGVHSFITTLKGNLRESEATGLLHKYCFSSTFREHIPAKDGNVQRNHPGHSDKAEGLFGNDPLLGNIQPHISDGDVRHTATKQLEGVSIDESF